MWTSLKQAESKRNYKRSKADLFSWFREGGWERGEGRGEGGGRGAGADGGIRRQGSEPHVRNKNKKQTRWDLKQVWLRNKKLLSRRGFSEKRVCFLDNNHIILDTVDIQMLCLLQKKSVSDDGHETFWFLRRYKRWRKYHQSHIKSRVKSYFDVVTLLRESVAADNSSFRAIAATVPDVLIVIILFGLVCGRIYYKLMRIPEMQKKKKKKKPRKKEKCRIWFVQLCELSWRVAEPPPPPPFSARPLHSSDICNPQNLMACKPSVMFLVSVFGSWLCLCMGL